MPSRDPRHELGVRGETIVCDLLRSRGYRIVARNERVGRKELDIIARRGRLIVFCEVRARRSAGFMSPLETLGRAKIERTRSAAAAWLRAHDLAGHAVRFDAAAVILEPEQTVDYRSDVF